MIEILTGDFRELSKDIKDDSIDLILTDPVYDRINDYRDLSRVAARVLKPDSACLVYCAIGLIPEIHDAMRAGGLAYRWRLVTRTVRRKEFCGRLLICTQECLWYEKGHSKPYQSIFDCQVNATKGYHNVNGANWGKSLEIITRYINTFSPPGGTVYDPFLGGGTTAVACYQLGRNCIGHEIDPQVADDARKRLAKTQPPLPGLKVNQLMLV